MKNSTVAKLIEKLNLKPHPEGGYFKETYRSSGEINSENLEGYSGKRNYSTCIYFLLTSEVFSAFHKIKQEEIWHFYQGATITLHTISPEGEHKIHNIGSNLDQGEVPQLVVPGGYWFAARILEPNAYALVGCTVSPGFDFEDFVLAERKTLKEKFPQHAELIEQLTQP